MKTGYISIAKQKARFLAGQVQLLLRFLKKGGAELNELTHDQIRTMVKKYLKNAVEMLDERWLVEQTPFGTAAEVQSKI